MPSAVELATQVSDDTGLDLTLDTAAIYRALNRAIRRVVVETDCLHGAPYTAAGDATTVDILTTGITLLRSIDSVYVLSGGAYSPLPQVPAHSVIDARPQSRASMYAWEGGAQALLLDGPVGVGNSIYIRYASSPAAITSATAEAAISSGTGVPIEFHEDLIGTLATVYVLEGYEGDEQRAAYYRTLALEALSRFKKFIVDRGGDELPNTRYGAGHFATPDPLSVR